MRRTMPVAATILAAGICAAHAAPAPAESSAPRLELPIEGVVANPDWIAKPSGQDVGRFYPTLARTIGIAGRAELNCRVTTLGALDGCKVQSEIPVGLGFGAATLALSPLFRMRPRTIDGAPVAGGGVEIPVRFVPQPSGTINPPPPRFPAPSQRSLNLARRLAAAIGGPGLSFATRHEIEGIKAMLSRQDPAPSDLEVSTRAAALNDLQQADEAASASAIDAIGAALAATFSEDDLAQIVTFAESKTGHAWFSHASEAQAAENAATQGLWADIRADAVARFCRQTACLQSPSPAE